jgi:predicted Zn-dependent protease with MMP-like domain
MPLRRRGSQAHQHPRRRINAPSFQRSLFERAVERAIDALPPQLRPLLEELAIVIEDEPNARQRRENGLGPGDALYGLYEGTPPTEYASDWVPFPNKITLFRLPLEEDFPDPVDLVEEVRRTLVHELAHHAGFDERRLEELGMD